MNKFLYKTPKNISNFFMFAIIILFSNSLVNTQTLTPLINTLNRPVGIAHHSPSNQLIVSVNYPNGVPNSFQLIASDGTTTPFSAASGYTGEVKIETAPDDGNGVSLGGFPAGELFSSSNVPGIIARISADGSSVNNSWATLPGTTVAGYISLHFDRTAVFGGDLIAVTKNGGVFRINSSGVVSNITTIAGIGLEGVSTIPNDVSKYGPWAGKIVAGAEAQGRFYTIDIGGNVAAYSLGIKPEDIDLVPANKNLFAVNYGVGTIYGAPSSEFTNYIGDILVTQEFNSMWIVKWDGTQFVTTQIVSGVGSAWEAVTFSTAGVKSIPVIILNQDPDCSGAEISDLISDENCQATISGDDVMGITDPDDDILTITVDPTILVLGKNTVTVNADDGKGGICSTEIIVNVIDDSDPVLTSNNQSIELWPPNHKYETIDIGDLDFTVSDNCTQLTTDDIFIMSVACDEKEDAKGNGDGKTVDDIIISSDCRTVDLRKESAGNGNGRVYTITFGIEDGNGNSASSTINVTVPKTKNGSPAINDGEEYSISAVCGLAKKNDAVSYEDNNVQIPHSYSLNQNYPNPFNPTTSISYSIPSDGYVTLAIYDALGKEVAVLENGYKTSGNYSHTFDASDLTSGIYFYTIRVGNFTNTKKMLLMK